MALHYTKSTNIEELTNRLWKGILKEKSESPLTSPKVIVPNKNMRKWLNLHLAKEKGLISLIDFSFLEKTLEEYFTIRSGKKWKQGNSIYPSQEEMQKSILQYLIQNRDIKDFTNLKTFLQRPSKLFGFSQKLALLFRDYEVNRREWLEIWWKEKSSASYKKSSKMDVLNNPDFAFSQSEYYAMEKKIYSDLFLPDIKNPIPMTLTQWFYQETGLLSFNKYSQELDLFSTSLQKPFSSIHLFCLSQLGYGYLELMEALAKSDGIDIYFYQFHSPLSNANNNDNSNSKNIFLNWQKPQTIIENFCLEKKSQILIANDSDPIHPSKKSNHSQKDSNSGLDSLKSIIDAVPMEKSGWKPSTLNNFESGSSDASVRVWSAPSVYREVEAVYQDILHKLKLNPELGYEDFAILVTDMSSYKPAVEWTFAGGTLMEIEKEDIAEREIQRLKIPYSLTDINAGDSSYLFTALQEIWKICKRDRVDIQSLKRLLSNPHVFSHLDSDTKLSMLEVLDQLQVKYEESGRVDDSFLISEGIRRSRLSAFFSNEKSLEINETPILENVSESLAINLTTLWEEFLSLRKDLIQIFTLNQWTKENLASASERLESFFRIREEDDEFYNFRKWKDNLLLWEGMDITGTQETWEKPTKKTTTKGKDIKSSLLNSGKLKRDSFELLTFITANAYNSIPYQHGEYLTYGVNVSLLQPMRPIPFAHIYILGLGEGKFPGRTDRSELNLRAQFSLSNRDTTRREVQEALFWETLHSAQYSLTLSYVGKDLKTDKIYEPCSTLSLLMNTLGIKHALEIPMHSYSKNYKYHGIENDTFEVNLGLVSYDYSRVWKDLDATQRKIPLGKFSDTEDLRTKWGFNKKENILKNKIFLLELIRHFRDPLTDYMKRKLQVHQEYSDENLEETDYEIFQLDALSNSILIREFYPILARDLEKSNHSSRDDWAMSWDEDRVRKELEVLYAPMKKSARFPQLVFSEIQIETYVDAVKKIIQIWANNLWGLGLKYIPHLVLGNTGLRKDGTKHIVDAFNNPSKLILNMGERKIQILHEWDSCFQLTENHWIWIYPKSLENEIKYDSYSSYPSNYWDSHSQVFFTLLVSKALGIRFTILNHRSLPKENLKFQLFGDSLVPTDTITSSAENTVPFGREEALEYLKDLFLSWEKEEITNFSPMNFLRFATESFKSLPRDSDEFWNQEDSEFQEYLLDDKDTALTELPDPVSLFSGAEEILEEMSLNFAKKFYRPLLYLYPDKASSAKGKNK